MSASVTRDQRLDDRPAENKKHQNRFTVESTWCLSGPIFSPDRLTRIYLAFSHAEKL